MKHFEESLRRLKAPDLEVVAFRQKLRRDLTVARGELSLRRWRRACLASAALSVVLAVALAAFVAAPTGSESATVSLADETWSTGGEISVDNDRQFIEQYFARQGQGVRIQSFDDERLLAIREFTMTDGQQMVIYTELNDGQSNRSTIPLNDRLPMLASRTSTTF
jgi:hypothetical protein